MDSYGKILTQNRQDTVKMNTTYSLWTVMFRLCVNSTVCVNNTECVNSTIDSTVCVNSTVCIIRVSRVNLTAVGGCCCSETGALRRRWSWLDLEPQIQAPPFQPICLGLNSNVSLRIQTQDRIFLAFSSRQHRVRFNVGSKLKVGCYGSKLSLGR